MLTVRVFSKIALDGLPLNFITDSVIRNVKVPRISPHNWGPALGKKRAGGM